MQDSGKFIYHFKIENTEDFERWMSAIEKFLPSNELMDFDAEGSFSLPTSRQSEIEDEPICSDELVQLLALSNSLNSQLLNLKGNIDASQISKNDKKDRENLFMNTTNSIIGNLIETGASMHKQTSLICELLARERKKSFDGYQRVHDAFYSCLNENNKLREKFGLEPSLPAKYLNREERTDPLSLDPELKKSVATAEIFYDAKEGDSSDEDSSSEEYSMHEPEVFIDDFSSSLPAHMQASESVPDDLLKLATPESELSYKTILDIPNHSSNIKRRSRLPAPAPSIESVSFVGILRNNIGKDLSTISMPISLNEPINLLQKLCEELEYSELLDKAACISDNVERMCLVAAFFVSGYSSSVHRAARKPFNPMLGETYEMDSCKGFKYIAEKVSHHPPIMAMHAESSAFIYHQDSLLRTKFWGKSMELVILSLP